MIFYGWDLKVTDAFLLKPLKFTGDFLQGTSKSPVNTLYEDLSILAVFDSINQFWLGFTMVVYEK